jgi:hypothetical protein
VITALLTPVVEKLKQNGEVIIRVKQMPYAYTYIRQSLYEKLRQAGLRENTRIKTMQDGNLLLTKIDTSENHVKEIAGREQVEHQLITDKCSDQLLRTYKFLLTEKALYGVEIKNRTVEQLRLLFPGVIEELNLIAYDTNRGVVLT